MGKEDYFFFAFFAGFAAFFAAFFATFFAMYGLPNRWNDENISREKLLVKALVEFSLKAFDARTKRYRRETCIFPR